MKLPYGYVLIGKEIVIHEEKADVVRSIFDDYLAVLASGDRDHILSGVFNQFLSEKSEPAE